MFSQKEQRTSNIYLGFESVVFLGKIFFSKVGWIISSSVSPFKNLKRKYNFRKSQPAVKYK
jgi:hypothetical protein